MNCIECSLTKHKQKIISIYDMRKQNKAGDTEMLTLDDFFLQLHSHIFIVLQCFPCRDSSQSSVSDWWILQEYSLLSHKLLQGPHLSVLGLPRVLWTSKIQTSASFSFRWVLRESAYQGKEGAFTTF